MTKTNRKKTSRRARKEARAAGVPVAPPTPSPKPAAPKPSTGSGPRRPAEPAPISQTVPRQHIPTAPRPAATVTFTGSGRSRTETGIDQRMAEIELPAIRKDLKKLAITLGVFGVIFTGLAVVGTQTDMVEQLGKSLFSLWQ